MKIKFRSITPVLLGGYNADYIDNLVRGTSLRGVIRWILRAIIAAAAIRRELDEIDTIKKVLPLIVGGQINGEIKSSRIIIRSFSRINHINKDVIRRDIIHRHIGFEYRVRERVLRARVTYRHQRLNLLWMDLDKKIIYEDQNQVKEGYRELYKVMQKIAENQRIATKLAWKPSEQEKIHITIPIRRGSGKRQRIQKTWKLREQEINIIQSHWEKYLNDLCNEISMRIGRIQNGVLQIYTLSKSISNEERLFAYATILAILILGIGKGSRRGLGALEITGDIELCDELKNLKNT